ncbi:MAG: glutamate ABC transporter substrate-binding protein [Pseudonocardiales bacterium]
MRWNPVLRMGMAVAVVAMVATACGEQESLDGDGAAPPYPVAENPQFEAGTTMAELSQAGRITIGTKFDQPLFGLQGIDGQLQGFDVEVGKIIAAGLGIEPTDIEWVQAPSGQREDLIQRGAVDMVLATYTINDRRRELISFAGPYYTAGQSLMVQSDNTTITGPESLRASGARVCSVQGSASSTNILEYIDVSQQVLFDGYAKCADALGTGQVDAVTTDNVILLGFISQRAGAFKLVGDPFTDEPYGVGIPKGDVAFCEFINEELRKAEASGSYLEAWDATAGAVTDEEPTLPQFDPCS